MNTYHIIERSTGRLMMVTKASDVLHVITMPELDYKACDAQHCNAGCEYLIKNRGQG